MISADQIERLLARLRESHPGMVDIYTRGACYELYEVLRVVWPQAEPWYDFEHGHVYTRIGQWWWDIRGRHRRISPHALPMRHHWPGDRPHRWKGRTWIEVRERHEERTRQQDGVETGPDSTHPGTIEERGQGARHRP